MRADVLGTFLRDAPSKDNYIATALQDMANKNVTWQITIQDSFTQDQKDLIRPGADPNQIRAFTQIHHGGNLQDGDIVKTIILDRFAASQLDFGKVLGHEIAHIYHDSSGNLLGEQQILNIEGQIYDHIYHSGRKINPTGSSSDSSGTLGGSGNDLIYATSGNNVVDASSGNNTVVSYSGNGLMVPKYGADYFSKEGNGAKAIKDGVVEILSSYHGYTLRMMSSFALSTMAPSTLVC